jgi:L-arabinose isomerase
MAGGSHHTILSWAVSTEIIGDFAEMASCEYLLVDAGTVVATFKKELRWNEAY